MWAVCRVFSNFPICQASPTRKLSRNDFQVKKCSFTVESDIPIYIMDDTHLKVNAFTYTFSMSEHCNILYTAL